MHRLMAQRSSPGRAWTPLRFSDHGGIIIRCLIIFLSWANSGGDFWAKCIIPWDRAVHISLGYIVFIVNEFLSEIYSECVLICMHTCSRCFTPPQLFTIFLSSSFLENC